MLRKEVGFFVSVFFLIGCFYMNMFMIVKIKNGEENEYIL